jgi:hypothetical protein
VNPIFKCENVSRLGITASCGVATLEGSSVKPGHFVIWRSGMASQNQTILSFDQVDELHKIH